jgi:hypothetical protein
MSNARTNDAWRARTQEGRIYASGSFKNVWEGTYTEGPRSGQRCVAKEFKTGSVYEDHYFEEEMNIIRRTQVIVDDFDAAGVLGNNRRILLNTPSVWTSDLSEQKALVEPMIVNFRKVQQQHGTGYKLRWIVSSALPNPPIQTPTSSLLVTNSVFPVFCRIQCSCLGHKIAGLQIWDWIESTCSSRDIAAVASVIDSGYGRL